MDVFGLKDALDLNKAVVFCANCRVSYSGRAESFLPDGDRLIIIKPDKTLLVHQPSGSVPINYMKENTSFRLLEENGLVVLQCSNNKEFMNIVINKVYFHDFHEMADAQKLQLTGSEKDMSVMIYNNPALIEPGFKPLSMEEHTRFGFIDVFGYDKNNVLVVVECKRYCADHKAVEQLNRYVKKIKETKGLDVVRGIIAAPRITSAAEQHISEFGFEFRRVNPPKYLEKFESRQRRLEF